VTEPASPYSPEPNVDREIWWMIAGTVALSVVIAVIMSYAP
jgi:hypothetical protein